MKNKLQFKKVEIRNSVALNHNQNNIIGKIKEDKLLKTKLLVNENKLNFYFNKNYENSEEKSDSKINSSKIKASKKNINIIIKEIFPLIKE